MQKKLALCCTPQFGSHGIPGIPTLLCPLAIVGLYSWLRGGQGASAVATGLWEGHQQGLGARGLPICQVQDVAHVGLCCGRGFASRGETGQDAAGISRPLPERGHFEKMKVEISLTSLVPFLGTGNYDSVTAEVWGKEREEGQVGNIVSLGASNGCRST